jgi:hypothetical protein
MNQVHKIIQETVDQVELTPTVIEPEPKEKYKFVLVPTDHCVAIWNSVRDLLEPAVERSHGRWTMEHLLAALCTGHQSLWVGYDSEGYLRIAMTTQIVTYPGTKLVSIHFLGGTGFDDWGDDVLALMERYAGDCGCDGVEAVARFGFWPLCKSRGYDRSYVTYELFLED